MATLIEQIQRDAIDSDVPVTTVLRRIKLAAAKLGLLQVESWVEHELKGYPELEVPEYRKIFGRPMGLNPYHGWIPLPKEFEGLFKGFHIIQPIASLEDLVTRESKHIQMDLSAAIAADIDDAVYPKLGRYSLHYSRAQVINLINAVRDLSLDWAMQMEKNGVTGTEFSFSNEERAKAQGASMSIVTGPIGTLIGNLGSGNTTGDITVGNVDVRAAAGLGEQIRGYLPQLQQEGVNPDDLRPYLDVIARETEQPTPSQGVVRGALIDLRNALSGAGGSLLASGILDGISRLLG